MMFKSLAIFSTYLGSSASALSNSANNLFTFSVFLFWKDLPVPVSFRAFLICSLSFTISGLYFFSDASIINSLYLSIIFPLISLAYSRSFLNLSWSISILDFAFVYNESACLTPNFCIANKWVVRCCGNSLNLESGW